jgi:dTDP-3-amino-3,6-dideoxy-alpha-D-glucopyranose N,N-dimethyltransferase/dTDP-3-amino-3,4,6-trideoxy-alpha-D-glucopyranose N,N-dimethyltransferase/N-methyltransferase
VDDASFGRSSVVYDVLYAAAGKDYAAEAAELHRMIQELRPGSRTLLDVACGTGMHLRYLADAYEVAGVDRSAHMLAEAAALLPGVPLVEADMRDFDVGRRFDAVTCLFSAIGYMSSTDDLDEAVRSMARHLNDRGVLVIDGWVRPEAWRDPGSVQALSGHQHGTAAARVIRSYRDDRRTTLELHLLIGTTTGVEHLSETHTLTLFSDREYRAALEGAGLTVADVVPSPHADRDRYVAVSSGEHGR